MQQPSSTLATTNTSDNNKTSSHSSTSFAGDGPIPKDTIVLNHKIQLLQSSDLPDRIEAALYFRRILAGGMYSMYVGMYIHVHRIVSSPVLKYLHMLLFAFPNTIWILSIFNFLMNPAFDWAYTINVLRSSNRFQPANRLFLKHWGSFSRPS